MRLLKHTSYSWISAALLSTACLISSVASADNAAMPTPNALGADSAASISIIPSPPQLNVKAYVLLDYNSGQVLAEKNMNERLPPASLTKLMTAYIVENMLESGRIKGSDEVRISKKAWQTGGSTMFLEVGEKETVLNLMKGLIVVSGNDAAVALAEYVAGSEGAFVQLMNATAKQMGLKNTHFEDVNGLPDKDHYSSAFDIALIASHIIRDHPQYYSLYKIKEFQHGVNKQTGKPLAPQPNRVTLLWTNPYVDGLKTGHTQAAGYCLTASAKREDRRLIAVVLDSPTYNGRDADAQKLLTFGYRFFSDVNAVKAGTLQTVRVWKGKENKLPIGVSSDVWVTVPKGDSSKVESKVSIDQKIKAPVAKGQVVGEIQVVLNGKTLRQVPVVAETAIEQGGFFKRFWDSLMLFFSNLF